VTGILNLQNKILWKIRDESFLIVEQDARHYFTILKKIEVPLWKLITQSPISKNYFRAYFRVLVTEEIFLNIFNKTQNK